jgi:uncharacterized protein YbjT (DUF2867 family)
MTKINAIVTGATGMVGEGVMHECLLHPDVEKVIIVNRRASGFSHPKLREIIVQDFFKLENLDEQFVGFNACYFCLGMSSVGQTEEKFTRTTYDLTMNFAKLVHKANPNATFCYVSGRGTDSTEKGKVMWARVKGRTENAIINMFKNGYAFRPGIMTPTKGLKNTIKLYTYLGWLIPLFRLITPVSSLKEVGLAMINITGKGYSKKTIEAPDIIALAKTG